ncbi:hypothetical protein K502DRAFT_350841 [Neoconidiobolus thromboides FSU 785]|nr:hypothetical protein K502DRAFT_350841 [Neoconidiobolus thromboides FSU 785]
MRFNTLINNFLLNKIHPKPKALFNFKYYSTNDNKSSDINQQISTWWPTFNVEAIPLSDKSVTFSFIRSSGPGGQNVNKVSSKVEFRVNLHSATWLPYFVRDKLLYDERYNKKVNKSGEYILTSDSFRTQIQNREAVLQKFYNNLKPIFDDIPKEMSLEAKLNMEKNLNIGKLKKEKIKKKHSEKKSLRRDKSWD